MHHTSSKNKPMGFVLLVIMASSLLLLNTIIAVDPLSWNPIYSNCSGASYAPKDPFQTNLKALLSTLSSTSLSSRFFNATVGAAPPDNAYGLFLCEGDLSHADCQHCIAAAAADVLSLCPARRQAFVWSDYCFLRYSDRNFFGIMGSAGEALYNINKLPSATTKPLEFVAELVKEAPLQQPLMFAANASVQDRMFAMAECTMDISSRDCAQCLDTSLKNIKKCCSGYQGWRYLAQSCTIRFESTPFFPVPVPSITPAPAPWGPAQPPPVQPPPPLPVQPPPPSPVQPSPPPAQQGVKSGGHGVRPGFLGGLVLLLLFGIGLVY